MARRKNDPVCIFIQGLGEQLAIALAQTRIGSKLKLYARFERLRGFFDALAHRIEKRSNLPRQMDREAQPPLELKLAGGKIGAIPEALRHFQHLRPRHRVNAGTSM